MSSEFVVYLISLRPAYRAWIDRQIRAGLLNTTAKASEVKDQIYPNPLEEAREYRDS